MPSSSSLPSHPSPCMMGQSHTQDARFTHLHATPEYLLGQLLDENPDANWKHVMPGFEQNLDIPAYLEPPRLDADEVLPSQVHPSYPFGRPKAEKQKGGGAGGNLRTIAGSFMTQDKEKWDELNMNAVVERPDGREVPPVMAGSKRPPSPPSPSLHPNSVPPPRSQHLRRHLERARHATPPAPADPFDAPVPNETYADDDPENPNNVEREDVTPE